MVKSAMMQNNRGSLYEITIMTTQRILSKLSEAIPTIVCIIAIALSVWIIMATEARAQNAVQVVKATFPLSHETTP